MAAAAGRSKHPGYSASPNMTVADFGSRHSERTAGWFSEDRSFGPTASGPAGNPGDHPGTTRPAMHQTPCASARIVPVRKHQPLAGAAVPRRSGGDIVRAGGRARRARCAGADQGHGGTRPAVHRDPAGQRGAGSQPASRHDPGPGGLRAAQGCGQRNCCLAGRRRLGAAGTGVRCSRRYSSPGSPVRSARPDRPHRGCCDL